MKNLRDIENLIKALEEVERRHKYAEKHRINPLEPIFFYRRKEVSKGIYRLEQDKILGVWEEDE